MEPDETSRKTGKGSSEKDKPEHVAGSVEEAFAALDRKLVRKDPESARRILDSLHMEDRAILISRLSGRDRLDMILLSSDADDLVKELPEPEFWITVKQLGEDDSLEILRMARPGQIQHIFDLEWWHKDKLDSLAVVYWLNLLAQAGPEVPVKWFNQADEELLISALGRFFKVYKTDPDNQGAEPWRDFKNLWTRDNTYYLHFLEPKTAPAIERVLQFISDDDPMRYYGLLEYIEASQPLETEDEAFRFRNARLADYGFIEFEEAIEIYAPLSDADLDRLDKQSPEEHLVSPGRSSMPEYPLALSEPPELFAQALKNTDDKARLETLAMELGGLVNRILVADSMDLARLESVKQALDKAYNYIETGLRRWAGDDPERAVQIVAGRHLVNIFRAGYTRVVLLARRANRMRKSGWMSKTDYSDELLGEDAAMIRGLTLLRPGFYHGTDEGGAALYKEFGSEEEVDRAEEDLLLAEVLGALFFDSLGLTDNDIELLKQYSAAAEISFSTVFITAVCRSLAGGELSFAPLSDRDARAALEIAMTGEVPRKVKEDVRHGLHERVEKALSGVEEADAKWIATARRFVDSSLKRLEEEAGRLRLEDIDPRYLQCLVVFPENGSG